MKALTGALLVAGIVLVIISAIIGGLIFAIIGDVLVVSGVLLYLYVRKTSGPPVQPMG